MTLVRTLYVDRVRRGIGCHLDPCFAGRQPRGDAYAHLSATDRESPLEPDNLERLATAAYLVGRDEDSAEIWARTHQERLNRDDVQRTAWCAFWLAFGLLNRAGHGRGSRSCARLWRYGSRHWGKAIGRPPRPRVRSAHACHCFTASKRRSSF